MGRNKIIGFLVLLLLAVPFDAFALENPQPAEQVKLFSLQQCLEMAASNNKQIQAEEKKVMIAKAAVKEAESSFWPTLNYQAKHEQSDVAQFQIGPTYEKTQVTAGVQADMPLYTGGILRDNVQLAKEQLESAREGVRKAKQQLTFEVKQAYYQVWLAKQIVQVQQASFNNLDQHVTRVKNRYQAETVSKLDLIRAQVQRDTLKPKVINAQNQLVLAKLQLATLMGYPADQPYDVQYDVRQLKMPELVTSSQLGILNEAYQNRPELRQIQQLRTVHQVLTRMAKARYKPNVAVSAGYGGLNKELAVDDWLTAWKLTFTIGGKIYDRAIQAKIEQAKGTEDVTALQEADLRDLIRLETEQALQNLQVSIESTRVSQASIDLARETLRMTQIRVDNGMATTMDIMDAQLALDQALNGYYQGVVSYLIAEAKIDLVAGRD